MPQIFFLAMIGTGFYTGMKWAANMMAAQAEAARKHAEEMARKAEAERMTPRDLGRLEWDDTAGVYRPRSGA